MLRTLALAAVATLLLPRLAAADEPSSEQPWSNVSHINGQLVPVGHRGDYLVKDTKRVNIATNPLGFFYGVYSLSVSVKASEHVAVRGNIEKLDYELFGHVDGFEATLSAPLYLRRTFSGPFFEPGVRYRETMETPWLLFSSEPAMAEAHTYLGPQMLVGWHWMFDSGLNVAFAVGASKDMEPDSGADPDLNGYLRVGYAF